MQPPVTSSDPYMGLGAADNGGGDNILLDKQDISLIPYPKEPIEGASPKRAREEEDEGEERWPWPMDSSDRPPHIGTGKRQRSIVDLVELTMESEANDDDPPLRTVSPTAVLSERLQVALGAEEESWILPLHRDHNRPASREFVMPIDDDLRAELTHELTAALRLCVASGDLPAAPYPEPTVARVTPKQRKWLASDVAYTSPLPLAVAGTAKKSERVKGAGEHRCEGTYADRNGIPPGGAGMPCSPNAEATGRLLLERMHLPKPIVGADVVKGHLNFKCRHVPYSQSSQNGRLERLAKNTELPSASGKKAAIVRQPGRASPAATQWPVQGREFELRLLPSADPSLPEVEFELYKKYQVLHHGDTPESVTLTTFIRFLCDSPLIPVSASAYPTGAAPPCGFGSFHQQYWVDGRLVAVGVVDILPRCLSSKYLFWDPDLALLSLGKLASLQEIAWVQEASTHCPSLHYYYLGYYIDNCHRMRYKADFRPADLLCPVGQCWVPISRVRHLLSSDARPPVLSAVPGALEGLGPEHLVTEQGEPAVRPRLPRMDEVNSVKLLLASAVFGAQEDAGKIHRRNAQIVTFGTLCSLGVMTAEVAARLRRRLERWITLVGPVWEQLVYRL